MLSYIFYVSLGIILILGVVVIPRICILFYVNRSESIKEELEKLVKTSERIKNIPKEVTKSPKIDRKIRLD
jgi:hypothetical protein